MILEIQDVLDFRTTESIDGLVVITNDTDIGFLV